MHDKRRSRAHLEARFSFRPHACNAVVLILMLAARSHAAPRVPAAFAAFFRPSLPSLGALRAPVAQQTRRAFTVRTSSSRATPTLWMSLEFDNTYQPGLGADYVGMSRLLTRAQPPAPVHAQIAPVSRQSRRRRLSLHHARHNAHPTPYANPYANPT